MLPTQKDVEIPLLRELLRRGGSSKPSDINENGQTISEALADYFDLSEAERNIQYYDHSSKKMRSKWYNIIRYAKWALKKKNFLSSPSYGVWAITEAGIKLIQEINAKEIHLDSNRNNAVSPELFQERQKQAAEIGEKGEFFVFKTEKKFLEDSCKDDLAEKVYWVAKEDVAAGYDILSFDLDGNPKYIEVKTSQFDLLEFYLTENELNTAQKHGESYWIYKVVNINSSPQIALKIQNPAEAIANGKLKLKPTEYRVIIGDEVKESKI